MKCTILSLLLLGLFSVVAQATSFPDDKVYSNSRLQMTVAEHQQARSCSVITIPRNMCNSCNLKPYDNRGRFPIRKEIYEIDEPACRAGIEEYARLNPCDTPRVNQVADFEGSRSELGEFMYTVCETCCDCVPFGAEADEYEERREGGVAQLTQLRRGNCPAHAVFDVCGYWPNIRSTTVPGRAGKESWPIICPLLRDWLDSDAADGWQTNPNVSMDRRITRFLRRFNSNAGCRKSHVWMECTAMEQAQRRI